MKPKRKTKEKNSNFVDNTNEDFEIYKKGAVLGGLFGGIAGLIINQRIILCIVIGAVAGGYINFKINKDDSQSFSLKKIKQQEQEEDDND